MRALILFLTAETLHANDVAWLNVANEAVPEFERDMLQETLTDWAQQQCALWRLLDPVHGLVMTRTAESANGERVLWIVRLAGENLVAHLPEVVENFQALAAAWNCSAVRTMIYDERLVEALRRAGCQPEAVQLVAPAKLPSAPNAEPESIEDLEFAQELPAIEAAPEVTEAAAERSDGEGKDEDSAIERASDVGSAGPATDRKQRHKRNRT